MTLPRKKSRTIVVEGETWCWRTNKGIRMDEPSKRRFAESQRLAVDKNPELKGKRFAMMFSGGDLQYVKTVSLIATRIGDKPFMIKAKFVDCERILPKVVSAVIAYANKHAGSEDKTFEIADAARIFENVMAESNEKEAEISREQRARSNMETSERAELSADKHILEGNYREAIGELRQSILYDKANHHRLSKLDHLIQDHNASAILYNCRAFSYYYLHKYDTTPGHLEKAYADATKAIDLDPEYGIVYGTLAEILYTRGDMQGFYKNLETALSKGMTQKIDSDISYTLRKEPKFVSLLQQFDKTIWIKGFLSLDEY